MPVTVRVTAKISKRLKRPIDLSPPASTGLLGDWYCNLLIIQRQHLLLLVSERTLLPLIIPAKDLASFPKRMVAALAEMLRTLGVPQAEIDAELRHTAEWTLAKTNSRQVLGSMNDFANMLEAFMDDRAPFLTQALRLARSPCSPIGMNNPIRATCDLFRVKVPREVYDFDFFTDRELPMTYSMMTNIKHLMPADPTVELPLPARKLKEFLGSVVMAASAARESLALSAIRCRKKMNRKPCPGLIQVKRQDLPYKAILWHCSECEDGGAITDWEKTHFDLSRKSPAATPSDEDPELEIFLSPEEHEALRCSGNRHYSLLAKKVG